MDFSKQRQSRAMSFNGAAMVLGGNNSQALFALFALPVVQWLHCFRSIGLPRPAAATSVSREDVDCERAQTLRHLVHDQHVSFLVSLRVSKSEFPPRMVDVLVFLEFYFLHCQVLFPPARLARGDNM